MLKPLLQIQGVLFLNFVCAEICVNLLVHKQYKCRLNYIHIFTHVLLVKKNPILMEKVA
jgi:hypothetical protein